MKHNSDVKFSRFRVIERVAADAEPIADVGVAVREALDGLVLDSNRLEGRRIAVAVGSRGVDRLSEIVRAACEWLKARGAQPFIFPAMGSHGAATAEGQRKVLEEYGVTEADVGAEVRPSMEALEVGRTPEGFPVLMGREAWESDGVLVINRVKPHTRFTGRIESGMLKMMAVGMGKVAGAGTMHRLAARHTFEEVIRAVAGTVIASGKILAGVGVVENAHHRAAAVRAAAPASIVAVEEEMLALSKSLLPSIPFRGVQLLVMDEIGKNVSGAGMDVKAIGRGDSATNDSGIELIYVRDLTPETTGNALGVGLADIIHERVFRKTDYEKMYVNAVTSLNPWVARMPMWFGSDREAIGFALEVLGAPDPEEQRIVMIRNTLCLDRMLASAALAAEAEAMGGWRVDEEAEDLSFDGSGEMPFPSVPTEMTVNIDSGGGHRSQ